MHTLSKMKYFSLTTHLVLLNVKREGVGRRERERERERKRKRGRGRENNLSMNIQM